MTRILVLDIETQAAIVETFGLFNQNHGIGQIVEPVSLLCFAAKWVGEKEVFFHASWDGQEAMVRAAHELVSEADYIVTWNGRRFDMPHLKAEFLLAGLEPPAPYRDIDLMLAAKKNFRFMSNKLDWYAKQLGVGNKVANGGFALWQELRRPKSEQSLVAARKKMRRYNEGDVRLTEKIFHILRPWIDGLNVALVDEREGMVCTRCGSGNVHARGFAYTTTSRYRRYQCQGCKSWLRGKRAEATSDLRSV